MEIGLHSGGTSVPTATNPATANTSVLANKQSYGMFDNSVTGLIAMVVIGLFAIGLTLVMCGSILGAVPIAMACLMIGYGWTKHGFISKGDDKDTVVAYHIGFITFRNKPIIVGGRCIVVDKSVLLAPYIGIRSILIDMTPKDMNFSVDIVSKDRIQMPIRVNIVAVAKPEELSSFIVYGNGKWDKIQNELELIISEKTEGVAMCHDCINMAQYGNLISQELQNHLATIIPSKMYGIEIKQVRAECKVPDSIASKMSSVLEAKLEAQARVNTVNGINEATKELITLCAEHGETMTWEQAREHVYTAAMLEDGDLRRVQFEIIGNKGNGPIIFNAARFSLGDDGGQKDGKNGKKNKKGAKNE